MNWGLECNGGCLSRPHFLETVLSKTNYVFSFMFLTVIYECSGVSLPALTWQSAPTAHQHHLSINGESSSVPGYSRGICHHEDTWGRTVWQIYNTEVRLHNFFVHLGIDHCWYSCQWVTGWVRCSFCTEVPGFLCLVLSQEQCWFFLYFSFSVLNRIVWKRLTWRGRTKLIPSRNKSLSWSWRRWADGKRNARLVRIFTASCVLFHGPSGICVWAGGKDSLNYLEYFYLYVSHFLNKGWLLLALGRMTYHPL